MDAQFFGFVFVGCVFILAAFGLRLGAPRRRGEPHPVVAVAVDLGLRRVTKTHAEGVYKGVQTTVMSTMLGWRVECFLGGPLPGGLTLAPEAMATALGATQDIQVGDAWLDYRLAIGGTDEVQAREFLMTQPVSDRVRLLFRRFAVAHVKKDRVVTEKEGELEPNRLVGWLDFVVDTVRILEGKTVEDAPEPTPIVAPAVPFAPVEAPFGGSGTADVLGDLRQELAQAAAQEPRDD